MEVDVKELRIVNQKLEASNQRVSNLEEQVSAQAEKLKEYENILNERIIYLDKQYESLQIPKQHNSQEHVENDNSATQNLSLHCSPSAIRRVTDTASRRVKKDDQESEREFILFYALYY